ncbi:MAG: hypothetical protein WDO71_01355 [Bacteroidota bacterium]
MKKILLSLLLTLPAFSMMAQNDKEPYLTKALNNETIKNVEVQTSGGSISVSDANASDIRIEVYITGNNNSDNLSKEEIKQRLDEKYELNISVSNNKLVAIARPKTKITDWKRTLNISFRVFVPKNISTDLSTSGGSISLAGIAGKQAFSTSGGSLNIDNVSGNISGKTSGGSIYVKNSTDDIELITSGGSIYAKNCEGNLKLITSGGSISLKELKGNIKATTSGGSISGMKISGELTARTSAGNIDLTDLTCSLETSTSAGNIDVSVATLGKYIKINNSGGNVDLELPKGKGIDLDLSANKIKTNELSNFTGEKNEDEIEGKLNGGGVRVDVRSGGGKINLVFK